MLPPPPLPQPQLTAGGLLAGGVAFSFDLASTGLNAGNNFGPRTLCLGGAAVPRASSGRSRGIEWSTVGAVHWQKAARRRGRKRKEEEGRGRKRKEEEGGGVGRGEAEGGGREMEEGERKIEGGGWINGLQSAQHR